MKQKLWFKFTLPVSIMVVIVCAAIILVNLSYMKELSSWQLAFQNRGFAKTVEGGMFESLAVGDNDRVRAQFESFHREFPELKVFVYDFNRRIVFSTEKESVGSAIGTIVSDAAAADIKEVVETGEESRQMFRQKFEDETFALVNRAIPNKKRCFHCHGSSAEVLGGISVFSSAAHATDAIEKGTNRSLVVGVAGLAALIGFVLIFFHFMVNKKIATVLSVTEKMRKGDLTEEIEVKDGDEMNHILARINLVNRELRHILGGVVDQSGHLDDASTHLSDISDKLLTESRKTSDYAGAVSAAAEQMSSNFNAIASSMADSTASLNTVASGSEEMSATVNEIAENAGAVKSVMESTAHEFARTSEKVETLGAAADDIDEVTDEIRSISEQVGLLALNARIEAARAGDAGKGFAVVAQEITDLAGDAGESAVKIDDKLKWMKEELKSAGFEMSALSESINETDEAVANIAAAVEEQSATSGEITGNISQVSEKIALVNDNVNEGAAAAGEIAGKIADVSKTSTVISENSDQVRSKAEKLSEMVDELKGLVSRFTV